MLKTIWKENGKTVLEEFCAPTFRQCIGFSMDSKTKTILALDVISPTRVNPKILPELVELVPGVFTDKDRSYILFADTASYRGNMLVSFNRAGTSQADHFLKKSKKRNK